MLLKHILRTPYALTEPLSAIQQRGAASQDVLSVKSFYGYGTATQIQSSVISAQPVRLGSDAK